MFIRAIKSMFNYDQQINGYYNFKNVSKLWNGHEGNGYGRNGNWNGNAGSNGHESWATRKTIWGYGDEPRGNVKEYRLSTRKERANGNCSRQLRPRNERHQYG